jgi:hypothetical protein
MADRPAVNREVAGSSPAAPVCLFAAGRAFPVRSAFGFVFFLAFFKKLGRRTQSSGTPIDGGNSVRREHRGLRWRGNCLLKADFCAATQNLFFMFLFLVAERAVRPDEDRLLPDSLQ